MGIRSLIAFPRNHPASASEASGAEREAETITNFGPMVDGIPLQCPVRSKAPARPPSFAESLPRGGTEPAPTVLPKIL